MTDQLDDKTQCIHSGTGRDMLGSPSQPLYDTTTFKFSSTAALMDVIEGRSAGYLYTRYGMNPTITALETRLAQLDNAEASLAFSSGMAAISALFFGHGLGGIVCVGEVYGGTFQLLSEQLPTLGFNTHFVSKDDTATVEKLLREGASLLYFETPANPTLDVIDINKLSTLAHKYGALSAVDNTFASPINQKPLQLGADFSIQSATKFLGGHSDLTAGVISANSALLLPINHWRKNLGQTIAAEVAHKLMRSLVTLPLRIEQHNRNALAIAQFLEDHSAVERVYYPGLTSFTGHEIAQKQMQGFGGMLSFDIKGSDEKATRFIDSFDLISLAPSLGGAETLVTQPVTTSHYGLSPQQLQQAGITGRMIRLSVGLEAIDDLIADLNNAFSRIST